MKISMEKNYIFNIFAQNIDCGYTLEPPWTPILFLAHLNAVMFDFHNIYIEKHCNHVRHFEIECF